MLILLRWWLKIGRGSRSRPCHHATHPRTRCATADDSDSIVSRDFFFHVNFGFSAALLRSWHKHNDPCDTDLRLQLSCPTLNRWNMATCQFQRLLSLCVDASTRLELSVIKHALELSTHELSHCIVQNKNKIYKTSRLTYSKLHVQIPVVNNTWPYSNGSELDS